MPSLTLLAHGDAVPVGRLASAWTADALPIVGAALAALLFAQAFWRLRARGRADHAPWWRAALFAAALALVALAVLSPLDEIGDEYLLSGHMLQHLVLGDLGPALLLVALRGPLVFFVVPPPALRAVAALRPLRALLGFLLRPVVAFALWTAATASWHVPQAYDYALAHPVVHDVEHATFFLAGCLVWAQLIDPARHGALKVPSGRVLYALSLFAVGHAVVHPILFGGGALYETYKAQDERLLGLSPLADQHWAGIVMTIEQVATLGTFCLVTLWPHLRRGAPALET